MHGHDNATDYQLRHTEQWEEYLDGEPPVQVLLPVPGMAVIALPEPAPGSTSKRHERARRAGRRLRGLLSV